MILKSMSKYSKAMGEMLLSFMDTSLSCWCLFCVSVHVVMLQRSGQKYVCSLHDVSTIPEFIHCTITTQIIHAVTEFDVSFILKCSSDKPYLIKVA